ncbi:PAS domain-containing protein [uncultured Hymenobacter sp.]|uniref:PAS domain-containing protein n=1 Tax=uncultured Hymenobacter sp. TaxID=170016 RepID=UPI0035C94DD5
MLPPPTLLSAVAPAEDLLRDLLAVSLTGVILYTPVYDLTGELIDFNFVYLNPTAQRMMGMPEQPTVTHLQQWPHSKEHGTFAFHVEAFVSGEPQEFNINYQADGYDNYYRLAARRTGQGLLVSFTDTADQPRAPVELALRESQAREQAARAEAEQQRADLQRLFEQAPVAICIFRGPDFVVELANPALTAIWRHLAPSVAYPYFATMPETSGPGLESVLTSVLHTGEPYFLREMPVTLPSSSAGPLDQGYFNFSFHPLRDAQGQTTGIVAAGTEVTEQVRARQQVEQFNQELEVRVMERTEQLELALTEARRQGLRLAQQQDLLQQILGQVPAAIATLEGPEHRYTFFNAGYYALSGQRAQQGRTVGEVLPELVTQGLVKRLDEVYATGKPRQGQAMPIQLYDAVTGRPEQRYLDFIYQPLLDGQAQPHGILAFLVDVTEQVQSRQQAETLQAQVLAATQRQVQERENLYHIFAQTPAAICIQRGPEHRYEYVNEAYEQFFPERQLLGRTVSEALPETVDSGILALLDHVYQTGETYFGYELPLLLAQPAGPARQMYFTFTYQAYRENGEIVGISTFAHDVTNQVLAHQEREAQQRQLHDLFMQAPAPIVILDGPDLVYQLVNPAYQLIFPGRELLHKPVVEALPELVGADIFNELQRVYATGETYVAHELPLQLARRTGGALESIYCTFIYQARRNAHGAIDGVLAFAHEVTDQVLARRVVDESEQRLRLLTDALPVLIGYLDREEKYQFVNQAYESWFNQSPASLLGRPVRDVIGEVAYSRVQGYIELALTGEPVQFDAEMPYRLDFTRYIRTSYVPDIQMGQVVGFYTLVVDTTPQVEAQRELEQSRRKALALAEELTVANEQLIRTNVDLDNFIYTASHDLKAPISNIEGLLYLLRDELPADAQQQNVQNMLALMLGSVERFKRTISHLTDVSKLQKEHAPVTTSVNLAAVVEDVCQDLAPLIQETGANLRIDLTNFPPVQFSEKNLRSVVYNLLSNALKYRSPARRPHVDVRAHVRADYTVLEVHDNGLGIDVAHLPKLFTMFQRFHTHVDGTGIGLYMVKRMVENAGGRLEVHSQLGAGTTFFVYLPHTEPSLASIK